MEDKRIEALNILLADYQVFYQKLRNYHWNITGKMFFGLHEQFEKMYDEVAENVDEIAERVRALEGRPLSTLSEQLEQARLSEDTGNPGDREMVQNVLADLENLIAFQRKLAAQASNEDDPATANLVEEFADGQEKTAWMLRSWLK
jgi:starvation-inducible DNA-binding protein